MTGIDVSHVGRVHNAPDTWAITSAVRRVKQAGPLPSTAPDFSMATTCFDTSLGRCAIAWKLDVITGFSLPPTRCRSERPLPWVTEIISRVQRHLTGEMQDFVDLPYSWDMVSDFQQNVYQAALSVKPGQTASYGQLAAATGYPSMAREVGGALGRNPWPLLIPCHRFIGADGRMIGFSSPGGIKTKLRLLALEGAQLFAE